MLRLAMSLLAAPFGAVVALMGAEVLDADTFTSWQRIPSYVFALVMTFGVLGVLPYLRLIEATARRMHAARAMNNFRLLYVRELGDHLKDLGWAPNLPTDPAYPDTFTPMSGPGVTVLTLALVDATYISLGMVGLSGTDPTPLVVLVWGSLTALVLFFVYYVRANVSRRRKRPTDPLDLPTTMDRRQGPTS